jgi:hypothetical protein
VDGAILDIRFDGYGTESVGGGFKYIAPEK